MSPDTMPVEGAPHLLAAAARDLAKFLGDVPEPPPGCHFEAHVSDQGRIVLMFTGPKLQSHVVLAGDGKAYFLEIQTDPGKD